MATNLTQEESLILSKLSYMTFKEDGVDAQLKGRSLTEIAEKFYRDKVPLDFGGYGALTNAEQNAMLKDIKDGKYPGLSNLVLKDYINTNPPSEALETKANGMVAYAFADKDNPSNTYFAFRGSEGSPVGASNLQAK